MTVETTPKSSSPYIKFTILITLTLTLISLYIINDVSNKTKEKISAVKSKIWTLDKKMDNEVKNLTMDINDMENQFSNLEFAIIITELQRTLATVSSISKGSTGITNSLSSQIMQDINYLIEDLKIKKRYTREGTSSRQILGEITVSPDETSLTIE